MTKHTLKKYFFLGKKIASSILKKKKIELNELNSMFSSEIKDEILYRLTNTDLKKKENALAESLDKSHQEDWLKIITEIQPKRNFRLLRRVGTTAAILLISFSYYLFKETKELQIPIENTLTLNPNAILLQLDNGNTEVITTNGSRKIVNTKGTIVGKQKGAQISYKENTVFKDTNEHIYHKLTIPFGKTFELELSDGTKIHLNSGSSLKYPIHFLKGKERKVYLQGEGYFDVSKDSLDAFVVSTDKLNIRVLGTSFNISSYKEDPMVQTVLVEGSVSLYANDVLYNKRESTLLKPGRKAIWDKESNSLKIEKVDTSIYTNWREGKIVFEHMQFKNILKKLERHYNIKIINRDKTLANEKFTGTFDIETIEQVLNSFDLNTEINYITENNTIIIN